MEPMCTDTCNHKCKCETECEGTCIPDISNDIFIEEISDEEAFILQTKQLRKDLDIPLQELKKSPRKSRERSIATTKLQEAIMWLGMDLKDLGTPNPYPNSRDTSNTIIEPTADNLKM